MSVLRLSLFIVMLACFASGQAMTNAQIDKKIKHLSSLNCDYEVAGEWFKLSKEIKNRELRQEVLKTAGAALLYSKKGGVYQNTVRSLIDDVTEFEESLIVDCDKCSGSRDYESECKKCEGARRCTYASCRDGQIYVRGVGTIPSRYDRCRECRGTGICQECKGKGRVTGKCRQCNGKGQRMSSDAMLQAYRDHASAARAILNGNMAAAKREKAIRERFMDPRTVAQTAWDKKKYEFSSEDKNALEKMVKTARQKSIAIAVDASTVKSSGFNLQSVGSSLVADLSSEIDGLGFLRVVTEFGNEQLLSFIEGGYGKASTVEIPDYILLCRLTYVSATPQWNPKKVMIKAFFQIYDRSVSATRFSKTITKEEPRPDSGPASDTVMRLFAVTAKEYMEQITGEIGPVGIVMKTTGGGRYAYISLGEKAGLVANGRVQFFKSGGNDFGGLVVDSYTDEDDDDAPGTGSKRVQNLKRRAEINWESVADGHVSEGTLPEPTRAWVVVENFDKNNPLVMPGMGVRIVPVSRTTKPSSSKNDSSPSNSFFDF